MPHRLFDAIIFVDKSPIFEIRNGLVHISQQVGSANIERVMLLSTFVATVAAATKALAEYNARGSAQVIPLPGAFAEAEEKDVANGH